MNSFPASQRMGPCGRFFFMGLLLMLASVAPYLRGQVSTATIRGTVHDSTGAVITTRDCRFDQCGHQGVVNHNLE
jgi:hypothetical protein